MFDRTQALRRVKHRHKEFYREENDHKHYTRAYRLAVAARLLKELEAIDWAIAQAEAMQNPPRTHRAKSHHIDPQSVATTGDAA